MSCAERPDNFEQARAHLQDLSDEELHTYFRELVDQVVTPLIEEARTYTTPSIERSVLLRMGFSSLECKALVAQMQAHDLLGHGAGRLVLELARGRALSAIENRRALVEVANDAFGAGYQIIDTPKVDWGVSGGPAYRQTRFDSVDPGTPTRESTPALVIGTVASWDITKWMEFEGNYRFQVVNEASGTYNHHMKTSFETELTSLLDFDVSWVWDRIQDPIADENGITPEQDDNRFRLRYQPLEKAPAEYRDLVRRYFAAVDSLRRLQVDRDRTGQGHAAGDLP